MSTDISQQLQSQILEAYKNSTPLCITGGNSKAFYGLPVEATPLDVSQHSGVLNYEPTELVITARAGSRLADIEKLLDENGQMLPFEPPAFAESATLGGTIACNLSGPRRAYAGAARDFLLGCKIINGKGEILSFGGEVMKNVAGYDVSRLMAGAMGTLGVLLEVSLKVLPKPETELTQQLTCTVDQALDRLHAWSQTPMPITASSYHDNQLHIRLSGAGNAVAAAVQNMGGETLDNAAAYWHNLKEQSLAFFEGDEALWRLSIASDTPANLFNALDDTRILYEWGGALRWLKGNISEEQILNIARDAGGHATLFRAGANMSDNRPAFQSLPNELLPIHRNLKQAFDPNGILNPGRLHPEL